MLTFRKTFVAIALCLAVVTTNVNAQKMQENTLSKPHQYLSAIACLQAKGDQEALAVALAGGLDAGLTISQLKEALSQLYAYTGFPRSLNALATLQRVLSERTAAGVVDDAGREPSPRPDGYDAFRDGSAVQTRLSGQPFNYEFAPATDYYLKAHLFGDIFSRDNLTFAQRELVTVSALAALAGVEPQLKAHVAGARNMGLSDSDIHSIPPTLASLVGKVEAYRAAKAIAEVYSEQFSDGEPLLNPIFPVGQPNDAYAKFFIGNSYLAPLNSDYLPLSNVTFEPRCRNNWHVHHDASQILICVGGEGWYQEWGKPARRLHPGDVVAIPPEVKHWHGATRDSWFQHIATAVTTGSNPSNEWLEPVTDEEYDKL